MVKRILNYLHDPKWRHQHKWRKAIWNTMARMGLTGVHSLPVRKDWIDFHRRPMPLRGLDPAMNGFTIVQISDLHYSPMVWKNYLVQFMRCINELKPDLVVVTGDLITGGYIFADRVARILHHLKAREGVICTFGNHDYTMFGKHMPRLGRKRADRMEERLEQHGIVVLRNEVHHVKPTKAATPLAIVGLDDEWSGHIDPDTAFQSVDPSLPIVCLNHNPANVLELMQYPWQWMLAGHTHGRQLAVTRVGKALNRKRFRHWTRGYYHLDGRHLYVNRGLSYGQRIHHWCRPEVTVFELEPEVSSE